MRISPTQLMLGIKLLADKPRRKINQKKKSTQKELYQKRYIPGREFQITTGVKKIFDLKGRYQLASGGTGASKTIGFLMKIIAMATNPANGPLVIGIGSRSYPHLESGVIRDFKRIMVDQGIWNQRSYRQAYPRKYFFGETGTEITFYSCGDSDWGKLRGPRFDIFFFNEVNDISERVFFEISTRTRKHIFADWNPFHRFWIYDSYITRDMGPGITLDFIGLTYLDNECLSEENIAEVEAMRANERLWKVYGLGELGDIQTVIYYNWQRIDKLPYEAQAICRGLDFGHGGSNTALCTVYKWGDGFVVEEELYSSDVQVADLIGLLRNLPRRSLPVICDSANNWLITELRKARINVFGADKKGGGQRSILPGILTVLENRIWFTEKSTNIAKERQAYLWDEDDKGNKTDEVAKNDRHDMMDAIRYAVVYAHRSQTFKRAIRPYKPPSGTTAMFNDRPRI